MCKRSGIRISLQCNANESEYSKICESGKISSIIYLVLFNLQGL